MRLTVFKKFYTSTTCSWINIFVNNFLITQSDLRDKFTVHVKFRLRTRVKYLNIILFTCHYHLILGKRYG